MEWVSHGAFCHSQNHLRTLDKRTVVPGSKGMAFVFEEHLLLHLKMGSSAVTHRDAEKVHRWPWSQRLITVLSGCES